MISDFEKDLIGHILKLNAKLCLVECELENTQKILYQIFSSADRVNKNVTTISDNFTNIRKAYDNYCKEIDKQIEKIYNIEERKDEENKD